MVKHSSASLPPAASREAGISHIRTARTDQRSRSRGRGGNDACGSKERRVAASIPSSSAREREQFGSSNTNFYARAANSPAAAKLFKRDPSVSLGKGGLRREDRRPAALNSRARRAPTRFPIATERSNRAISSRESRFRLGEVDANRRPRAKRIGDRRELREKRVESGNSAA